MSEPLSGQGRNKNGLDGFKVRLLNQEPSTLSSRLIKAITANRTHLIFGELGGEQDARDMAEKMGGGQGSAQMMGPEGPSGGEPKAGSPE